MKPQICHIRQWARPGTKQDDGTKETIYAAECGPHGFKVETTSKGRRKTEVDLHREKYQS